jgi:hypothetical protein
VERRIVVLRDPDSAQQQDSASEQPADGREDQQNSFLFRAQQDECIGWRREDKVSGIVGAKDHRDEQAPEPSVHNLRQQKVHQHRGHPEDPERYHSARQQHHQVYLEEQEERREVGASSSRSAQVDRSLSIRKQYALKSENSIISSSSQYSQTVHLEKARESAEEDHGESIRVAVYKEEEEEEEEEAEEDYDYDTKYEMEMLTGANFAQSSSNRGSKSRQGHSSPETRDIRQGQNSVATKKAIFCA